MTADDATMNVVIWIFSFLKPLLEYLKFIYILRLSNLLDYLKIQTYLSLALLVCIAGMT